MSKKDPETAKEILKSFDEIAKSFTDDDKKALAKELVGHMKSNQAFSNCVLEFIEEYIKTEVKTNNSDKTLFRGTELFASSCLTAVQNKSLEKSLPHVVKTIKNNSPKSGFSTASPDEKSKIISKGLEGLAKEMKKVDPNMQRVYTTLYTEVSSKYGTSTAETQLA